jgi:shikimate dehydrogenase
MIRLGLVGYPLSHSLSPKLHEAAFKALGWQGEYRLYPVAPGEIPGLAELTNAMRNSEIQGLNVTIPHKQAIIALLDELTPSAQAIGAVNTLYFQDGKLIGHNTDASGFLADQAKFLGKSLYEKKALVMGAGGAARAVVFALLGDGWEVTLAVRGADINQAEMLRKSFETLPGAERMNVVLLDAGTLGQHRSGIGLIVNATPIGMFPEIDYSPWPDGLAFPDGAAVYDLVYNPRLTRLVREAQVAGLRAITGLGMLVEQAALSFACWTGQVVSREEMYTALEA